ncbi:MAG TPA: nucleoside triphosphate pyrophosphohydrolase [Chitinophagaceae bacterium]|nr:nucleoside triphosphate pyrophosphohydrolase [Chitinophagaceae bacterium]
MNNTNYSQSFDRIKNIMCELRAQCPWDKKQTIATLRQMTIEEMYELADAITKEDWEGIKEELGDLLLHILFYATIAEEQKKFNINEVIETVCNKLVYRHPHIYSFTKVQDDDEVKRNWENLKLKEGKGKKSVLSGVPLGLPAMTKALRLQEKAKQVGFEWEVAVQVKDKINEELQELDEVIAAQNQSQIEDEFGDVLFSLINYARFLHVDPENALERTNQKFQRRFMKMEEVLTANGKTLNDYTLQEMDQQWDAIKKHE